MENSYANNIEIEFDIFRDKFKELLEDFYNKTGCLIDSIEIRNRWDFDSNIQVYLPVGD